MIEEEDLVRGSPAQALLLPYAADLASVTWPYIALFGPEGLCLVTLVVGPHGIAVEQTAGISVQHPVAHLVGTQVAGQHVFVACSASGCYTIFTPAGAVVSGILFKTVLGCCCWEDFMVVVTPVEVLLYSNIGVGMNAAGESALESAAHPHQQDRKGCKDSSSVVRFSHRLAKCLETSTSAPVNIQFLPLPATSSDRPSIYIICGTELITFNGEQFGSVPYFAQLFSGSSTPVTALSFIKGLGQHDLLLVQTPEEMHICTLSPVPLRPLLTIPINDNVLVVFSGAVTDDLIICLSHTTGIFYIPCLSPVSTLITSQTPQATGYIYTDNLVVTGVVQGAFITAKNLPLHHVLVTENESVLLCETPNVNIKFLDVYPTFESNSAFLATGNLIICDRSVYYRGYWQHPIPEPTRDAIQQVFTIDGNPKAPQDHYIFITNNQLIIYHVLLGEVDDKTVPQLESVAHEDIPHSYGHSMVFHNMTRKIIHEGMDIVSIALQVNDRCRIIDFPCYWDDESKQYAFYEPSSTDNFNCFRHLSERSLNKIIYEFPADSAVAFFVSTLQGEIFARFIDDSAEKIAKLENRGVMEPVEGGTDVLLNLKDKADKVPIHCQLLHENTLYMIKSSYLLITYDFSILTQRTYELRNIVSVVSGMSLNAASLGEPKTMIYTNNRLILLINSSIYYIVFSSGSDSYYDLYQVYARKIEELYRINSTVDRFLTLSYIDEQPCLFELSIVQCNNGLLFDDKWTFEGHHLFSDDIDEQAAEVELVTTTGKSIEVFQTESTMMVFLPKKQQIITCSVVDKISNSDTIAIKDQSKEARSRTLCDALIRRRKFRKVRINLAEIGKMHAFRHQFTHLHFFATQSTPLIYGIMDRLNINFADVLKNKAGNSHGMHTESDMAMAMGASSKQLTQAQDPVCYIVFGYCNLSKRVFLLAAYLDCVACPSALLTDQMFISRREEGYHIYDKYMSCVKKDDAMVFLRTTAKNCSPVLREGSVGAGGILDSMQLDDRVLFFTTLGYCYMYDVVLNSAPGGLSPIDAVMLRLNSYINICEQVGAKLSDKLELVCVGKLPSAIQSDQCNLQVGSGSNRIYLVVSTGSSYFFLTVDFCNTLYTTTYNSMTPLTCARPKLMLILKDYAFVAWKNNILTLRLPEGVPLKTYSVSSDILNLYYFNGQLIAFAGEGRIWMLNLATGEI